MARLKDTPMQAIPEALPQEGGSYTRQPDGALVRNPEPAQVPEAPVESSPTETAPVQE